MTVHQFPPRGGQPGPDWPTLDIPRDDDPDRHVQASTAITVRVDATDQFMRLPLRIVYTSDGLTGWRLELGPYDLEGRDACRLANMLVEYGRLSGDFRPAGTDR